MGFRGGPFTWRNNRTGDAFVQHRLDRFVASSAWSNAFSAATVFNLGASVSDHVPVLINFDGGGDVRKVPKRFRFEEMWLRHARCEEVVAASWAGDGGVAEKVGRCADSLGAWNRSCFGNVNRSLRLKKAELQRLKCASTTSHSIERCRELSNDINKLLERKEIMWK